MKKLLIGLLALGSFSAFASDYCSLTRMSTGEVLYQTTQDLDSEFVMVFVSPDFKKVEVQTDENALNLYKKGNVIASFGKNDSKFTLSFIEVKKTLAAGEESPSLKPITTGYDSKSLVLHTADLGMACVSF